MQYEIIFYESRRGNNPVEDYILSLTKKAQAKVYKSLEILQVEGVNTPYPYVSHIRNKIFELRIKLGNNQHRILYFIHIGRKIILLHGFTKKTKAIQAKDLSLAQDRMSKYLNRGINENT